MNIITKILGASTLLAMAMAATAAAAPAEELLQAVDTMTPEQAHEFSSTLEAKLWKPVPEGLFSRLAVGLDFSAQSLDRVKLDGLSPSAGPFDLDSASGMDVSLLWQVWDPQFRLGLRIGGYSAEDSNLTEGGYSRTTLAGGHGALVANAQLLRTERWLVWVEVAAGAGGLEVEAVDTPTEAATTLRELDGDYAFADLRAGVSWRFNPLMSLHAAVGYRAAEECDLEEGGNNAGFTVDPSGFGASLGLGINF